jgi:hypothetical protein
MKQESVLCRSVESLTVGHNRKKIRGRRAVEELLLLCVTDSLSATSQQRIEQILDQPLNWKYLLNLATLHGIIPLVAHNLAKSGFSARIPQPYREKLNRSYKQMSYYNLVLARELGNVITALIQRRVEVITLKGTALSEDLYGDPSLRMVTDIDILVRPADISLTRTVIAGIGYRQVGVTEFQNHPFHGAPYKKEGSYPIYLELHWALEDSQVIVIPEEVIWRRAQTLHLQGLDTTVLSPEDNLLFLANHLSKSDYHLLKFLGDIAGLLKRYQDSLDWDYITRSAYSWQIAPVVYWVLRRAKDIIGAPVPSSVLGMLSPREWRRWLVDLLLDEESLISPVRWPRLRSNTIALARSLTISGYRRRWVILSRHFNSRKLTVWLEVVFWAMLVFLASLWRRAARLARQ